MLVRGALTLVLAGCLMPPAEERGAASLVTKNGPLLNGRHVNGPLANGRHVNKRHVNGELAGGRHVTGLGLDGGRLLVTLEDGTVASGRELEGTEISAAAVDGASVRLRIERRARARRPRDQPQKRCLVGAGATT